MTDINKLTGEKYNSEKRKEIISSAYHIRGPNWKPKTKKDYIDLIVKSGYWTKTKKTLQDMDIKAVIQEYRIMLMKQQVDFMRKI